MTNISSAALSSRPAQINRPVAMRRNKNSVRIGVISGFGPIANVLVLGIILCSLGVMYLTQVTKTNSYGYQINELKSTRDSLSAKKQQLEVDIAKAQSLNTIADSSVATALVDQAEDTIYIQN